MNHRQSNVEFVVDLMEYSEHGALIQAFVIHALKQYARRVAAVTPEQLDTGLVSGHAWHGCAVEVGRKLAQWLGEEISEPPGACHAAANARESSGDSDS
ncbi:MULTISPECIES: hypothetical protein [Variovorax]|uniref:hypothetical protein n=1 Tax=Variovorax TaxID=34072 RepID=UPI0018018843|nr:MULTISPECIES: hypothetical protein [unclassified Variovorax]MBB3639645.1 hypothetical protein [Variovorax sp. BK613]MDN6886819.1 hypothetical protein [Variovorax sp. CAN15]